MNAAPADFRVTHPRGNVGDGSPVAESCDTPPPKPPHGIALARACREHFGAGVRLYGEGSALIRWLDAYEAETERLWQAGWGRAG